MIRRILNSRLPLIVYNPVKIFQINYFKEIFNSGALPVFDTEFLNSDDIIKKIVLLSKTSLSKTSLTKKNFSFGVRLFDHDIDLIEKIKQLNLINLDILICPDAHDDSTADFSNFADTKIILEIKDININKKISKASPHALILKGNEAGGRVSKYSSFILMQWYLKNSNLPLFIHGGVGKYTAAGMFASGVSGIVMDSQFLLTDQAPVSQNFKKLLSMVEESDSTQIEYNDANIFRVFAKLGTKIVKELKQKTVEVKNDDNGNKKIYQFIIDNTAGFDKDDIQFIQSLFYLGQDGIFAKDFIKDSTNLNEVITAFFKDIGKNLNFIDEHDPVTPDSQFAQDQKTKFPLIQGPMANISDNSEFANRVLEHGALPFFAVGSLPENLADNMLKHGSKKVDNFGAGLVGIEAFNPAINSHLEIVKKYRVPYALFAGGIPSQAAELEKAGTKTYLHTPSVSMMENALKNGCKRFIFEGGEAGGHVGALSSMVLWENAISFLINNKYDLSELYLVFAGGISTCSASYFISGLTSFLAAKGAKIGIQVGTAYLFTDEIIDSKCIKSQYREIIIKENATMVIGKSLGLASRTAPTKFARMMVKNEAAMLKNKESLSKRKRSFEKRNIGSLLIGAKGFLPDFKNPGPENYTWFENEEHKEKGNFLVGDSLTFFDKAMTIQQVHDKYFDAKSNLYNNINLLEIFSNSKNKINDEIAVVGVGCTLPHAEDPDTLWDNILNKRYSISKMPESRFDYDLYYDPDKKAMDKTYTTLAGHVDNFEFDKARFGYAEGKEKRLSRSQQMVLQTAYKAVENAGLLGKDNRLISDDVSRTAVIVATCLSNELGNELYLKYWYPQILSMMEKTEEYKTLNDKEKESVKQVLMEGMEGENKGYDPVHGSLLNIEASRIARHLGIRGANYVVDAACASSVTALEAATGELLSGEHDQVIVGGVNTNLAPEAFVGFAKMGTLSSKGSFPFDERADGFILGEGSVVFVLKRVKDAIRDKNHIWGIINSIGASSDGKGKAIAAPNPKGQKLSVQRCFENIKSSITPDDIGFIEAHGTSTTIGDEAEITTLNSIYKNSNAGISSIKAQIGHLLGCAGSVGLLKALLTVDKGILPPNGQFENLAKNHDLKDSSMFIIKNPKKWKSDENQSRKAAVSSYGFGGINYHIVVEQMTSNYKILHRDIFKDTSYDFNDDRIVVAGLGVFLPGAKNSQEFWAKLESGEKQLSYVPEERFDNNAYASFDKDSNYRLPKIKAGIVKEHKFNNLKYRMPPMMVKSIERGQIFGLEAANEALENSGLLGQINSGNKIGVILGTISGERQSKNIIRTRKQFLGNIIKTCKNIDKQKLNNISQQLVNYICDTIPENNEDTTPGLLSNIIAGRIANYFNLNGASYVIDASCASAFIAMKNAARNLKQKELDFVLAGGVDCNLYPAVLMAFKRLGLLSEDQCNFYDSRSDGYVMGEGAAIHIMTTYKKAKEYNMEILGEINECSVRSSVPDHLLAPSGLTFASTIDETYQKSGIRKQDINHIDMFAFSNVFGDIVEKQVIEQCFDHEMSCGNIKPQFGYFKAANPAVAMAKLMLMNKNGKMLPNFNYDEKHSTIKDSKVLKPAQQVIIKQKNQPFKFASNVNGIGGNHCHMIMSTLPNSLQENQEEATDTDTDTDTNSISTTNQTGDNMVLKDHSYSNDNQGKKLKMVALLSGQGAQRDCMMKDLFAKDAHIRDIMEKGEKIFVEQRGYSLLGIMFGSDDAINSTQNTQPAVFLASAAIYSRLSKEGFSPDYFIGHSVGEYTALFCCGILSFDDAMRLIIKRSDLMYESTLKTPGKIMVVFKNEKETEQFIKKSSISNIYITNKNSEKQTAVSGKSKDIEKFSAFLTDQSVLYKKLNLTGAFHTPILKDASIKLRAYLDTITFNKTKFGKIISNTTAKPYPEKRDKVKDLLARQIISPVEFIKSIENVYESTRTHFIEIGPSRLLVNLLKNINIEEYSTAVSVDAKTGEVKSFERCRKYLLDCNSIFIDAIEKFDFNTGKIVISGVSVGLPGKTRRVFAADNFDAILNGENFIDTLTLEAQEKIIDKNITKLYKQPDGNARFVQITKTEDVIHLAGQLGYFDLTDEYGIKAQYDISMAIAIAAGIEALKDADIPLVMQYKKVKGKTSTIPDGFALPKEMQEETGVIVSSILPNIETFITELEKYYYDKLFLKPYEEFENIYYYLMEKIKEHDIKKQLTEWFFKARSRKQPDFTTFKFDRNFLANATPLGASYLAQIIKAKGPNTLVSAACASTTLAIGIAEDWIRVGRCKRVIVIGGDNMSSPKQGPWVESGFLAVGAATIKKRVSEGAKPFDENRNGTIIGAGAVGLVIEKESCAKKRGMNGQCEILGTHIANSAYHAFNIDVPHMAHEMKKFITKVEKQNSIRKAEYADKLLFMSHETYTPARGGSADAEVTALRTTFADHLNSICISNTKGFTGHTLGAAIEDVVMVKALQKRKAPPIANLKKIPEHFKDLNFSGQSKINCEYGLHLAAGFGSHFAFMFVKRIEENLIQDNAKYENWIKKITGSQNPELKIINNTLCAVDRVESLAPLTKEIKRVENTIPDKPVIPLTPAAPAPVEKMKKTAAIDETETESVEEADRGISEEISAMEPAIQTVKSIIAEQTGYTSDMLEDDLDLEADLGIDTVKQVEIFAKIASRFKFEVPDDLKLRELNTISRLSNYINTRTKRSKENQLEQQTPLIETSKIPQADEAGQTKDIAVPAAVMDSDFPDPASPIKRLIVRARESDQLPLSNKDFKDKTIIVSLDNHGFAKAVIKKIKDKNGKVITIGAKGADFKFDLTDVKAVEKRVEEFKKSYRDINGFIHLAPLDFYFDQKKVKDNFENSLNVTVKSFFVMIKSLFETLDKKTTVIGTITFDSVVFPYMDGCNEIFPMFAGLSGLLKTANKELKNSRVKVVDFSYKQPKKSITTITANFINELMSDDTRCEVGYKSNKRYVLGMKPSIADKSQQIITNGDTMLVTGGAGGITYEIIKKVVEKYKINLIILDINDIYSTDSKYLDKSSTDPQLMAMLKEDMPSVKPIEIKRALDRLIRVRQSVENIEYLESLGISVEYNCVDVTDAKAVKDAVYKYDKIDGIFHAAGMEMSQFIAKKELWSFELVVDVKVKGMQNLLEAFKKRDYKYFFTFSSVTARFGNEGQVDYTAANDFLGKTLFREKQLHPERTYKVYAWTAWGGVGMATNPTVKKVLEERGIQFLPKKQGVKFFMADLLDKTESEMVFSGLDYSFDIDGLLKSPENIEFPFLDTQIEKTDTQMTFSRVLEIERDLFLNDHTMEDVPLFLGSTGIETMAEMAKALSEGKEHFVELTDFHIPYGIKLLKKRPKELLISGRKNSKDLNSKDLNSKDLNSKNLNSKNLVECKITSVFKNPQGVIIGDPKLHYEGKYRFSNKALKPKRIKLPKFNPLSFKGDLETLIYNPKRLFMFGLFGTITDINSFDGKILITTMEDKSEKEFFKGVKKPNFVASPILVDAMFQTGGLFEFFTTSRTVLPFKIESLKFYKEAEKHTKYFCITQKQASKEETNTYSLKLVDKNGNLFVEISSFEMVKINKVAPEDQIADLVEFTPAKSKKW